ncbi:MAG: citrate lyase subunit alpha [Synergistaceae bacterium]|jgi:citrate lyase subunit alpha/citrate CoA-transferase|nr:citrate lyase subunit alpha [Synergistaceae bacterium]
MSAKTRNALGREIPACIEGYGPTIPWTGLEGRRPAGRRRGRIFRPGGKSGKVLRSLEDAVAASGLQSGMTISFHHHLRNGDHVINAVLEVCARMGIRDLTLFPTALFPVHEPLLNHIRSGVIRKIMGSVNGALGRMISRGGMEAPVVLRSHGGRPRAIMSGEAPVDVAFIAAPAADRFGNLSGQTGKSACGPLGYARTDAEYADCVVGVTDNLLPGLLVPASISQVYTDFVVEIPSIGDPKGIVSGSTAVTKDPLHLMIARYAAGVIETSPLFREGISFQTGASGTALAVTSFMREAMLRRGIRGSFGLGGITGFFVNLLEEGLLTHLLDVQSFDAAAVESLARNPGHGEISADEYANPWNAGAAVNMLDVVVLGATEIDRNFNVNVNTESDGMLLHGIGGHQDTAAGAALTIVAQPLTRGRVPCVVENVHCVTTPGEAIDVLVTEYGATINPRRQDLLECIKEARDVPVVSMDELIEKALRISGPMDPLETEERIVAVLEWRDGSVLDVIRQVK